MKLLRNSLYKGHMRLFIGQRYAVYGFRKRKKYGLRLVRYD